MDTLELCVSDGARGLVQTTASGKPFWCADPRPEDVRIEDIAEQLGRECRFGGALRRAEPGEQEVFYSVAQHSVLVCDNVKSPELKLAALLHDAAEAYVKDIPKPLKALLAQDVHSQSRVLSALVEHLPQKALIKAGPRFNLDALAQAICAALPDYSRVERAVTRAIAARFRLDPDLFHHHEIAEADYRAVLTEKRDLLPTCPEVDWGTPRLPPFPERIVPLRPSAASALFLQRFRELYKGE